MNEVAELLLEAEDFFAPVSTDTVSTLTARYNAERAKIERFHRDYQATGLGGVISYFCRRSEDRMPSFDLEIAICALNSDFWREALALTDVYDAMPQKRRTEWNDQLTAWKEPRYKKGAKPEHDLPDFTEEVVRATLQDLLAARSRFFAERVDGIFRNLSREHVTNCPQGFSKRMILNGVLSYGSPDWTKCGYINDLRCVIAKFMGRDAPVHDATRPVVAAAMRNPGEWMNIDGGALRIRVYNGVGTAHLEVHPDMAWRLNAVLASLYPAAIPESFRRKPAKAKKIKDFVLFDRPLPFAVVSAISSMEQARELNPRRDEWRQNTFINLPMTRQLRVSVDYDKHIVQEIDRVMGAIGGVKIKPAKGSSYYQFDYEVTPVIDEIVCSGCVPDYKSHQFYPTPEGLAKKVIEIAEIEDHHQVLEPSAGTGGIADHVPEHVYLQCYEISQLHCKVLEAKGFQRTGQRKASCLDFLKLAAEYRGGGYDRVVMNPPFSENRWKLHTEAAGKVLKKNGSIIAILPTSAKAQLDMPGFNMKWYGPYDNEFAGTAISVVILRADKIEGK